MSIHTHLQSLSTPTKSPKFVPLLLRRNSFLTKKKEKKNKTPAGVQQLWVRQALEIVAHTLPRELIDYTLVLFAFLLCSIDYVWQENEMQSSCFLLFSFFFLLCMSRYRALNLVIKESYFCYFFLAVFIMRTNVMEWKRHSKERKRKRERERGRNKVIKVWVC